MKNPIEVIQNLLNNIPIAGSMVFVSPKGEIVPVNDMVGKTIESGWKLEERSVDEGKKAVIKELFGEEKITVKSYRKYFDTIISLGKFVERSMEASVRGNLKLHNVESIGSVKFKDMRGVQ